MPKADGKGTSSVPEKTPGASVDVSPHGEESPDKGKAAQLQGPNPGGSGKSKY